MIFDIFNLEDKNFNLVYKLYEKEILEVAENKHIITPDWFLYSAEDFSIFIDTYIEEVDENWDIIFEDYSIENYRELEKEKPYIINLVFDVVFDWRIEYEKINYHTPFFHSFSANLRQQKNPSNEEFVENS